MKLMRWIGASIICATAMSVGAPQGTVPRGAPDKYQGHAEQNGVSIGATLLTSSQARKAFKTDVGRCCFVVEVALYPQNGDPVDVSLDDFALRIVGQDIGAKPSTPKVVAWRSSDDRDRLRPTLILAMEQELTERALPLGNTATPVSGYLYFSVPKVKNPKYQLEYIFKGNKVVLALG